MVGKEEESLKRVSSVANSFAREIDQREKIWRGEDGITSMRSLPKSLLLHETIGPTFELSAAGSP